MSEFFKTAMGRDFYDRTMPMLAKAVEHLATAVEKEKTSLNPEATIYTKENILKYATEDELFALFHTFKEYYNRDYAGVPSFEETPEFKPLDKQIGETVRRMKNECK